MGGRGCGYGQLAGGCFYGLVLNRSSASRVAL